MPKLIRTTGVNMAAGYPNWWSADVQAIIGPQMNSLITWAFMRISPLAMILNIRSDIEMCGTTYQICDDAANLGIVQGLAIDGFLKPERLSPPKVVAWNGFRKEGMSLKVPKEVMDCINTSPLLREWFMGVMQSRMMNFHRKHMARAGIELNNYVDIRNTGHNAGMESGGIDLGAPDSPLVVNPKNVHTFITALLMTKAQMPETNILGNELFGPGDCGLFAIAPPVMEQIFMQAPLYNEYRFIGDCNPCSYFTDTFDRKPGGIVFVKHHCLMPQTCQDASGITKTAWPILFGCRNAGMDYHVKFEQQFQEVKERGSDSLFYDVVSYSTPLHVQNPCFLGRAWVRFEPDVLVSETMCPTPPVLPEPPEGGA